MAQIGYKKGLKVYSQEAKSVYTLEPYNTMGKEEKKLGQEPDVLGNFEASEVKVEVYCPSCNVYKDVVLNIQPRIPGDDEEDIRPETGDDHAEDVMVCPKCGDQMKIETIGEVLKEGEPK